MATAVIMPKQGQSVETCIITRWFRKKGDRVATGDILFSYETDKASFDLESPSDGTILEIYYTHGAEVPILTTVAVIGQPGEKLESDNPAGTAAIPPVRESKFQLEAPILRVAPVNKPGRIRISPRARKMAEEKNINYSLMQGTGPNGRIVARDIESAASTGVMKKVIHELYTDNPLTNVRKLIAKAMYASLQNSAQLTHHMSADVRKLLEARKRIKSKLSSDKNQSDITLNDMVCWCVIRALKKFPGLNSHLLDDKLRSFSNVHLGFAVDTSRGLMVPAVKNADEMDISELSAELRKIAEACRKGNIDPELIQSTAASFTVSNLGNYGVEMFTPVINLPQLAILGVCAIINRPADIGNGIIGFVPYMGLSLTYDHRAVDGGPATLFLKEIKEQIENFE